jgi:hypothetical protein
MTPEQMIGFYGQDWKRGLLVDHVEAFKVAGGEIREAASGSGRAWAIVPGLPAAPVVCGDIIRVDTEDGPVSGNCGAPAGAQGACDFHEAQHAEWAAQTDAEALAWERQRDFEECF